MYFIYLTSLIYILDFLKYLFIEFIYLFISKQTHQDGVGFSLGEVRCRCRLGLGLGLGLG